MNDPDITERLEIPDPFDQQAAAQAEGPREPAETPDDSPREAAEEAKPLALMWLENALGMLRVALRGLEANTYGDVRLGLALETIRRHFHTDRRSSTASEPEAIKLVEQNFQAIRRAMSASASIFLSADDETASRNTRGYFGSGLIVAAYAYTQRSVTFTSHFPSLGQKCKSAVLIHQLGHYIDARMRDQSCGGLIYDLADFETSVFNVHCYPNFAVNATPPYLDERYGLTRPGI